MEEVEPGHGWRPGGLLVCVALRVVGHTVALPRRGPDGDPVLGVGLQPGQLGLVGRVAGDARLALKGLA